MQIGLRNAHIITEFQIAQGFGQIGSYGACKVFGVSVHGATVTYFPCGAEFRRTAALGMRSCRFFDDHDMRDFADTVGSKGFTANVMRKDCLGIGKHGRVQGMRKNPQGLTLQSLPHGLKGLDLGLVQMMRRASVMTENQYQHLGILELIEANAPVKVILEQEIRGLFPPLMGGQLPEGSRAKRG